MNRMKVLCATLSLIFGISFHPSIAAAQDPADIALAQATQAKLAELKAVKAELEKVKSPAASQVASCEYKLQESLSCTASGCDPRSAYDYCGRSLARAASQAPDYSARLNSISSGLRGIKVQLGNIERKVDVIDGTTQRTEEGVDSANNKLDDLKSGQQRLENGLAEVNRMILKAQASGLCNNEIEQIKALDPAAQVVALQRLQTCVNQRPDLTKLGVSAIEEGVGFVGTADMIIVDPTQERGSSGWKKVAVIGGSTVGGALLGAGIGAWAYPAVTDAGQGFQKDSAALKGAAIMGGTTLLTSLLVTALTD